MRLNFLKIALAVAFCPGVVTLCAQTARPFDDRPVTAPPSRELLLLELDSRRPDEASPFFAQQQVDKFLDSSTGRTLSERQGIAVYPNTAVQDSADRIFGRFYRTLVRDLPVGPKQPDFTVALEVTPGASFLLADRRQITARIKFTNTSKKLARIFFPTSQRFDFTITDEVGAILTQWSRDRVFGEAQGMVIVNPDEKIEYEATLPTAGMEAGRTYTLRAELADNPQYSHTIALEPR